MRILRRVADFPSHLGTLGFVPTMGALHEGHLSLIRAAKKECATVVVSLFVNPLQFAPSEDLAKYPRDEGRDILLAEEAGGDLMFIPAVGELTPAQLTTIHVPGVSDLFEGERRPGHFDGVATIVCKLFNIVHPDVAYFGLKDRQQCAVVRRMVQDLNMPVSLRFLPTVREKDGLALSSRNVYLSPKERALAPKLYEHLVLCQKHLCNVRIEDERTFQEITLEFSEKLSSFGFEVEYFTLIDESTFTAARKLDANSVLVAAVRLGATRLIDNVSILAG